MSDFQKLEEAKDNLKDLAELVKSIKILIKNNQKAINFKECIDEIEGQIDYITECIERK